MKFSILIVVDVADVKKKMEIDVSSYEIKDLVVLIDDKQPLVIFFELSNELKEMISKLNNIYESEIFQIIWKQTFETAKHEIENDKMDLEELLELVWRPTFMRCYGVLTDVEKGTISLANVDEYFQSFNGQNDRLEKDLLNIVDVCEMDMERTAITRQVEKVASYHQQIACSEAADKILEFQKKMELDENGFDELEEFRQQVILFIFQIVIIMFLEIICFSRLPSFCS